MSTRTLCLLKPDAVRRRLVGAILTRIEAEGFSIDQVSVLGAYGTPNSHPGRGWRPHLFYGRQHAGKHYFDALVAFMASDTCWALIISHETEDAIQQWRQVLAEIRREWIVPGTPPAYNLVHGSDSVESYEHELQSLRSDGALR